MLLIRISLDVKCTDTNNRKRIIVENLDLILIRMGRYLSPAVRNLQTKIILFRYPCSTRIVSVRTLSAHYFMNLMSTKYF